MNKTFFLVLGLFLLFGTEILRVYFIMPFPGSQQSDTIGMAYFLHRNINWLRLLGLVCITIPVYFIWTEGKLLQKIVVTSLILTYVLVFYMFNFRFLADKMFYPSTHPSLYSNTDSKVDTNQLIIGCYINGQAKAYPIEIIGYHHQVRDSIGGEPVMVTYCTVCRTGRIFSPLQNGKAENYRLVGMDHFNAMFEDQSTQSWWRQSTGEAIAGPQKGNALKEFPSSQMRLASWIRKYPGTLILQPDTLYKKQYADLQGYDSGTIKGNLEKRDSSSWKFKSWVIGVVLDGHAKAYDWNELVKTKTINDSIAGEPVVLVMEKDNYSFHVWKRTVKNQVLQFDWNSLLQRVEDRDTHSAWDADGIAIEGPYKDDRLLPVQSYQEFWHSWRSFHPNTSKYK